MYRPTLAETMNGKLTRLDSVRLVERLRMEKLAGAGDAPKAVSAFKIWA
jgi:hypothetical protein